MRTIFMLIMLFAFCISTVLFGATGTDVVPINWTRLVSSESKDSLTVQTGRLVQNVGKYFLNEWLDSCPTNSSGLFVFPVDPGGEGTPRVPADGAAILGITLATGIYDSTVTGRSEDSARVLEAKLIKSLVGTYGQGPGGGWGGCWQCSMWASCAALGAWLVWQDLDSTTKSQVAKMLENEANRFNYDPPYCNDCTGDTKAEENAWNAMSLTLAAAMMPNHPKVEQWKNRGSQWLLSAYARESDLSRNVLVDGKLPREWITGWNMHEQGYVFNHNIMHPDYMMCIDQKLYTLLFQSLANQTVSQAGIFDFDVVYKCFVDYNFSAPTWSPPRGTIYIPGKAKVYYPNGSDWSRYCVERFLEMDAFAFALPGIGDNVSTPASTWAKIRTDTLGWMQSRFTTGQHYAPGEWDGGGQAPWKLAEMYGGRLISISYFLFWLKERNGFMPVGNWHLSSPDSIPPSAPSSITAVAQSPTDVFLHWPVVADIGSGTAYYYVYRNEVQVGFSKDTFWLDSSCRSNTQYRYSVSALDLNNNEGLKSVDAVVSTLEDTSTLVILKATPLFSGKEVNVLFNKTVDSTSAVNVAHYTINGQHPLGAIINSSASQVTLTVNTLPVGVCTLIVNNVTDNRQPPRSIADDYKTLFAYNSGTISITADNEYILYFNGVKIGSDNDWRNVESHKVALSANNVIAVECGNAGDVAGLLAEININGNRFIGSSNQWKVSVSVSEGWEDVGFNESGWSFATDLGAYPLSPWNTITGFNLTTPAHWIWWSSANSKTYFRCGFLMDSASVGIQELRGYLEVPSLTCTPNPFNPRTRITLSGSKDGTVQVYSTNGALVSRLQLKNGIVEWDASSMPSGIYLVRTNIGSTILKSKAILMK